MKLIATTRVALCVVVAAAPVMADGTTAKKSTPRIQIREVSLANGGLMTGQALTTGAKPIPNAEVLVQFGPHVVARTRTDANGAFAVRGLRSGVHTVAVGAQTHRCRFWTATTAPPSAVKTLAVTGDTRVLRAQMINPPLNVEAVMLGIGCGLIGGVIGYNVRDSGGRRRVASP